MDKTIVSLLLGQKTAFSAMLGMAPEGPMRDMLAAQITSIEAQLAASERTVKDVVAAGMFAKLFEAASDAEKVSARTMWATEAPARKTALALRAEADDLKLQAVAKQAEADKLLADSGKTATAWLNVAKRIGLDVNGFALHVTDADKGEFRPIGAKKVKPDGDKVSTREAVNYTVDGFTGNHAAIVKHLFGELTDYTRLLPSDSAGKWSTPFRKFVESGGVLKDGRIIKSA